MIELVRVHFWTGYGPLSEIALPFDQRGEPFGVVARIEAGAIKVDRGGQLIQASVPRCRPPGMRRQPTNFLSQPSLGSTNSGLAGDTSCIPLLCGRRTVWFFPTIPSGFGYRDQNSLFQGSILLLSQEYLKLQRNVSDGFGFVSTLSSGWHKR
jgi:hypothetical protein